MFASFAVCDSSQVSSMYSPVHVIVVGAGCRGENYAKFASIHPKRMKVRREPLVDSLFGISV